MRQLIFPLVLGLGGIATLISLGFWQLDRLEWKEEMLAEIETRIVSPPVALPATFDPDKDRYLPVQVQGAYLPGEILVLTGMKGVGAGYKVITPFETDTGRRILIDQGFVAEARKTDARPPNQAEIIGNLHWPRESDWFTPDPDVDGRLWFARDVPSMAKTLDTEPVLVVLRETTAIAPEVKPQPVSTAGIPNDHLGYAITWFGLAIVWLGMTVVLIRRIRHRST